MKKHAEDIGVSTAWKKNFFKSLFGDRQRNFLLTLLKVLEAGYDCVNVLNDTVVDGSHVVILIGLL